MTGTVNRVKGEGSFAFLTDLDEMPTPEGGIFAHHSNFVRPELMALGTRVSFDPLFLKTRDRWEAFNVTKATTSI